MRHGDDDGAADESQVLCVCCCCCCRWSMLRSFILLLAFNWFHIARSSYIYFASARVVPRHVGHRGSCAIQCDAGQRYRLRSRTFTRTRFLPLELKVEIKFKCKEKKKRKNAEKSGKFKYVTPADRHPLRNFNSAQNTRSHLHRIHSFIHTQAARAANVE